MILKEERREIKVTGEGETHSVSLFSNLLHEAIAIQLDGPVEP